MNKENQKNDTQGKRYNLVSPEWLMDKMRSRSASLGMSVSGYIRYLVVKDLDLMDNPKKSNND